MIRKHLTKDIYIADAAVHVFNGKLYIYPSHDEDTGVPEDDLGSHFDMRDYHIFSMEDIDTEAVDEGVGLHIKDIPWAGRRSEEHTSELQSRPHLVCRLLLEKK